MSVETDYGIYPLVADEDIEIDLEERYDSMTAAELTTYAIKAGVTPPDDAGRWVIGKLQAVGRNRSGHAVTVPMGLFWSPPDYLFTVEMGRHYDEEATRNAQTH